MKRIVSIQIPEDQMETTLSIEQHPEASFEFKVYYTIAHRNKRHLGSFMTFKEAFDYVTETVNTFYK